MSKPKYILAEWYHKRIVQEAPHVRDWADGLLEMIYARTEERDLLWKQTQAAHRIIKDSMEDTYDGD